jgi:DNA-binding MarR family transcriptional regulator
MNINALTDYIETILDIKIELVPLKKKSSLPLFLRTGYELYTCNIFNHTYSIAQAPINTDTTPAQFKKHLELLKQLTGLDPILILRTIDPFLRKKLIEYKVSFIVPGNQMYLPLLMIDLREHFSNAGKKTITLSPTAQLMVLYNIIKGLEFPITPVSLAKQFNYTKMTMSRVIDELENIGICRVGQRGKNRFVWIESEGKELWEKVNQFMRSPVKKKVYIRFLQESIMTELPKAGISALSEKTLLSSGDIPVYATSKEDYTVLKEQNKIKIVENGFEAQAQLEIWYYNPKILGRQDVVDELSLFLSLREDTDERVQIALTELMEKFKWSR